MIHPVRQVFSSSAYLLLALAIFSIMLFGLLLVSEYIFLEPYFVGHLPKGTEVGLLLIVVLCVLSALVVPMNLFRVIYLKTSGKKMGGGVFGSTIGAVSGMCSCGPIGFAVITTFGSVGSAASAFLMSYEIHIRIAAIAILLVTYFATVRSFRAECNVKFD